MESQDLFVDNKELFKDEWVQAFLKGVSLIPQHGDGIRLQLAISLLVEDPQPDWHRFIHSTLSEDRVISLLERAISQHETRNISTERLSPERVSGLWGAYRSSTIDMLADYVFTCDENLLSHPNDDEREEVLVNFFNNPLHKREIKELKKMLKAVKDAFRKKEVLDLLQEYKADVEENFKLTKKGTSEIWVQKYRPRFINMINSMIRTAFDGSLPEAAEVLFSEVL